MPLGEDKKKKKKEIKMSPDIAKCPLGCKNVPSGEKHESVSMSHYDGDQCFLTEKPRDKRTRTHWRA